MTLLIIGSIPNWARILPYLNLEGVRLVLSDRLKTGIDALKTADARAVLIDASASPTDGSALAHDISIQYPLVPIVLVTGAPSDNLEASLHLGGLDGGTARFGLEGLSDHIRTQIERDLPGRKRLAPPRPFYERTKAS